MGDGLNFRAGSAFVPHPGYRIVADFRQTPAELEGCFTTFYHVTLEVARDGATLTDHLQPEWANIRFFCGGTPRAAIGDHQVTGARFAGTGPSVLPCRFELGQVRMWGIGFLPLG